MHKLANYGLMFRTENSKEVLHCKVALPFCRNTRSEENDPNIEVSENLLCPAQGSEPRGITEDHIGKARHYDEAEENNYQDVSENIEYTIKYGSDTHALVRFWDELSNSPQ